MLNNTLRKEEKGRFNKHNGNGEETGRKKGRKEGVGLGPGGPLLPQQQMERANGAVREVMRFPHDLSD